MHTTCILLVYDAYCGHLLCLFNMLWLTFKFIFRIRIMGYLRFLKISVSVWVFVNTILLSHFINTINNVLQLRFAGSQWLRKNYVAQLYCRSAATEHWTNFCSRWKTRNKRQRSARKTCRIYASGECLYIRFFFFWKFNVKTGWTTQII